MFQTTVGPVQDEGSTVYLRPETAQGIFLNFKNYLQFARKKPPFGIAQIGKSFRNEITPGNFIFRMREFEQMEMEFFVPPDEADQWYEYWMRRATTGTSNLGIRPDHLRLRAHDADELSHYSSGTSDVEYLFPIGWSELEGIANRGDFDLTQHAEFSGQKLEYVDTATGERYVPHVIEPAAGADRATLAFLVDAYDEDEIEGETRTVLRLHPRSRRSRWRCCRWSARTASRSSRARSTRAARAHARPSTTRAARSADATGARTRSAPPGRSRSTTSRSRTARSRCATATASRRCGSRSGARRRDPRAARRAVALTKLNRYPRPAGSPAGAREGGACQTTQPRDQRPRSPPIGSPTPTCTIQWDFSDAEPWHLRIARSYAPTAAAPGRVADPDLTFRCRFEDWVDIAAGRRSAVALAAPREDPAEWQAPDAHWAPKLFGLGTLVRQIASVSGAEVAAV